MTYERRLKGSQLWRRIPEAEAKSLTGERFPMLATGIVVDTAFAFVRASERQATLPGCEEPERGAYS